MFTPHECVNADPDRWPAECASCQQIPYPYTRHRREGRYSVPARLRLVRRVALYRSVAIRTGAPVEVGRHTDLDETAHDRAVRIWDRAVTAQLVDEGAVNV